MNSIFERRSIRRYSGEKITDENINMLLKAAMAAPSAMNSQCWEFVVIREKDTLKKITEFHPYSSMLLGADTAIVVCGDLTKIMADEYWIQNCSAATQNILLEATALGIGSVWLGVYPNENFVARLSKMLNLPDNIKPLNIISLGMPDELKPQRNNFDEKKVHYEKY